MVCWPRWFPGGDGRFEGACMDGLKPVHAEATAEADSLRE